MNFKRALVIDDEVEIGLLLSTLLNKMGIEAIYASNLTTGLRMYEETKPHVVFLDLNLPDGSGFSLVPKIKNAAYPAQVVVITAQDGEKERAMASHLGVDFIIPKPLSRNHIVDALQYLTNATKN
ncbi:hypothetical protein BH09BAC1_BH09BAC1_08900 [soil metagenome]